LIDVKPSIPRVTVERLPIYLQCLDEVPSAQWISSENLAAMAGVNPAQVRKDLSYLGSYGVRGVGYDVDHLRRQIELQLGSGRVAIIGAGNLGAALAKYHGFSERGFTISGLFDDDPDKVGTYIDDRIVEPMERLESALAERAVEIAIIATPADGAQEVAERVAAAGVTSILNFAPVILQVPPHIDVRRVDLSTELQILSFYIKRR